MRKYFTIFSLITLILISSIIGCRVKKADKVLAKVGDRIITVGDFERRFRPKPFPSTEEERAEKMKILNTMIEEKLFAVAGEKEGMAEEIEKDLDDYPDRLAVNQLYEEVIVKKTKVSLAEMKRTYRNMERELHGRHILCKTKEDAEKVYRELIKNDAKNFAELAKNSLDLKTRDKAGDLGWFSWGKMDPEHQEVAYKLKKREISKPFQTRFGWDILQIVDERGKKLRPFEEEKETISKTIKRQKIAKLANDYLEKLKKRAKINYDTTVINLLVEKTPTVKPKSPFEPPPSPVLTEEEGKMVVATSVLSTVTAAELLKMAEKAPRRPPLNTQDAIIRYIEGDIINQLLINQARRMHLHKSPEVIKNYTNVKDNRIAGEYRKKYVVPPEEIPEEELKNYYEKHKEDFKVEEKRETRIVVVNSKEEADGIYRTLKRGGDIRKIAKGKSTHYTKGREGKLGPLTKARFPAEFKGKAFSLKKGQISKPFEIKDGFVVMKLTNIEPATYLELEKVKTRIKNNIKNEERENTKNELVDRLMKEISVVINEDVLLMAGKMEKEEEKK